MSDIYSFMQLRHVIHPQVKVRVLLTFCNSLLLLNCNYSTSETGDLTNVIDLLVCS